MTRLSPSVTELREKVVLSCRMIGSRGVSRGSFGHVSARIPGAEGTIFIKSKGPDEEALEFTTEPVGIRGQPFGDEHVCRPRDSLWKPCLQGCNRDGQVRNKR